MRAGYTLIEMLVVIALIGLVAALVVPRLSRQGPTPSAVSISLSSYLNSAGSYASSHEQQVCVSKEGEQIKSVPWEERFSIPKGVSITPFSFCFDQKGKVPYPISILLDNGSEYASVRVGTSYGNARPE